MQILLAGGRQARQQAGEAVRHEDANALVLVLAERHVDRVRRGAVHRDRGTDGNGGVGRERGQNRAGRGRVGSLTNPRGLIGVAGPPGIVAV